METTKFNWEKIIGYTLLTPPILSVFLFIINLFVSHYDFKVFNNLADEWTGWLRVGDTGGGGYTSALPFYFGLMAIAGAYLIKNSNKKK